MVRIALLSAWLAVVAGAALPGVASAQENDLEDDQGQGGQDRAKARHLLDSGDRHLVRGDRLLKRGKKVKAQDEYLAALAAYKAAHEAFNSPKIYFAIALAEKRLGRYIDALDHFERLLAELDEVPEKMRSEVERHVNQVKKNLGVIFFRIEPEGASIEIDGKAIGKSPLDRPYYVVPGEHKYLIEHEGYKTLSGTVELEGGDVREDPMALEKITKEPIVVEKDDDLPPPMPPRHRDKTQLYVGLGLTGGFAVAATVTGLLALSRHNTFTDANADPAKREDARTSGRNLALATDALVIGALAAATYTTFYYLRVYRRGEGEEAAPARGVSLVPALSPGAAGLALGGRF